METTNPYPPPVSPREEVENDNLQPPITGSQSSLLPVDDVAHNHEQYMESISPSLMTSLENSVDHRQPPPPPPLEDGDFQQENENRQPEIANSSSQVFIQSPRELIEKVEYQHHQQLLNSISPNMLPENSVDYRIPPPHEDGEDQQEPPSPVPPEDKISDGEQPFKPPSSVSVIPPSLPLTEVEYPSENLSSNRESPLLKQSPSLSPSLPPTEAEFNPPENPSTYQESPPEDLSSNHVSPLSKQPPSPSPPPGYSPENLGFNHEYPPENVSLNHESQLKQLPSPSLSPSSPQTESNRPPENSSPNNESLLSKQPPSPSLSPSPPPAEAKYLPENVSSNNESQLSKQPRSPSLSLSPPQAEADYLPENRSPNHESPLSKQPSLPSPSLPATEAEYPPENLSLNHESTISKPSLSPSPSPSPSLTRPEEPPENPNYQINPNADHESPSSPVELLGNPNPSPKLKQSPKDLSPSPPLTIASPSSPQQDTLEPNTRTPPLGVPLLLHAAATFSPSRPQISPWTHQETANLIQAYQEKWYSLKKGPLKAGQWEEVAITVAARCGYDEPTKTSKQCRHKIEKLRKRYRTERGKPRSKATVWNFFKLMDNLEKGPLPISSSQPMELVEYQKPSTSNGKKRKNDVYDDDDDDPEFLGNRRSSSSRARNSNHHIANGGLARNLRFSEGGNRVVRGLRTPVIHKRIYQEEREEENHENVCEEEDVAGQLAVEIKDFAEKFVKMENKKIEMMRDVERYRLEMETKRMEMIIESQQMLVETVNNAFGSSVKTQRLSAS